MKQLSMRLRALREGNGLSQSKFADVISSIQSSINRYESCQAMPTISMFPWTISLRGAMIRMESSMRQSRRSMQIIRNLEGLLKCALFQNHR